jgi:hypothetical protein
MKMKKECAEGSPQGSPVGGSQGSPAGGSQAYYVNAILKKVDEINAGGLNILEWLTTTINEWPEGPSGWAAALDESFPPDSTIQYCTEASLMDAEGNHTVVHARLGQLALHPQSGASGMIEAPVARNLIGAILMNGFCTDANSMQGVEMIAGKPPNPRLTDACAWKTPYSVHGKSVAPLFSIFHVKGWKRAVAAATVATLVMQLELTLPDRMIVNLATVHVLLKRPTSLRNSIEESRRITVTCASTRLRPNCFNYVHQLMLLRLEGGSDTATEVMRWNKRNIMEAHAPNAKKTASKL